MALPPTIYRASLHLADTGRGVYETIQTSVAQEFIAALAARLERVIIWFVTITEATIYLTIGAETFDTAIRVKAGAS